MRSAMRRLNYSWGLSRIRSALPLFLLLLSLPLLSLLFLLLWPPLDFLLPALWPLLLPVAVRFVGGHVSWFLISVSRRPSVQF
jgi:hypothetical protein